MCVSTYGRGCDHVDVTDLTQVATLWSHRGRSVTSDKTTVSKCKRGFQDKNINVLTSVKELAWDEMRWILDDFPAAAKHLMHNKAHIEYRSAVDSTLNHSEAAASFHDNTEHRLASKGPRAVSRTDRFTCQQTFAVHRSLEYAALHAGCENMCITGAASPPGSRAAEQIFLVSASSLFIYPINTSCVPFSLFIELTWPNNINN